jgi:hypothetical protein
LCPSNAGAFYFESRCSLDQLDQINWDAAQATRWSGPGISPSVKEGKQAEFLVERSFPWQLVEKIGVCGQLRAQLVANLISGASHQPLASLCRERQDIAVESRFLAFFRCKFCLPYDVW